MAQQAGARISGRALVVGGKRVPLYSGAMHYWRLNPAHWKRGLQQLADMGLPMVETYVPWSVHELAPGHFDFGDEDPQRDVGRFLDLASEVGLLAFVRPGPHINSEMTYFGLPERIVYDRACQARSPRQNAVILPFPPRMFPVPSYASEHYHEQVGHWFDAVAQVIAPRAHPRGSVALIQVDNEAAFYFRNGPYDQDYHPDAVAQYRRFVEARHGSLQAAAKSHGRDYEEWGDVQPPKRLQASRAPELAWHLEWAEFLETLITTSLTRLTARLAEAGVQDLPVVHNFPMGEGGIPVNMHAVSEVVDVAGHDYYHPAREHRTIKRRTLYLAGTMDLPYAPELGVGAPPWFTPLSHDDSLYCALCACAHGLRGFNLYMAVDRDRWYGAPIDAGGVPRIEAGAWQKLIGGLKRTAFHELHREVEVALIIPSEYRRLTRATHTLGGMVSPSALEALGGTPVDGCTEETFGFKGPVQVLWWRMLARIADALTAAKIPYVYADSEVPAARLADMSLVVTPSFEFATPARWKRLCAIARSGTKVVYGPAMPEIDDGMRHHLFELPKNGQCVLIDSPDDARELIAQLADDLSLRVPFPATPDHVETAVHEDSVGPRVLFVMNPAPEAVRATVAAPSPMRMTDMLSGEEFEISHSLEIELGGLSCRLFELEPPNHATEGVARKSPRARRAQ